MVGFATNVDHLVKIPVVKELVGRVAEWRPNIKWLLFSSIVNFLDRARLVHLDINFHIKLPTLVSALALNFLHDYMDCLHVAELEF